MSINTIAKPQNSPIRVESEPIKESMVPPKKQQKDETAEIELNIPTVLLFIAAFAAIIVGAIYLFRNGGNIGTKTTLPNTLQETLADVTVNLEDFAIKGDSNAKYIFLEFSDFECPYCKIFATGIDPRYQQRQVSTYSQIVKNYVDTKMIQYGYAPYSLVASHQPAANNENIGYFCAKDQGKAFEYVEKTFEQTQANGLGIDGKTAEKSAVVALAKSIGLDEQKFSSCYDKRDTTKIEAVKSRIDSQVKGPWAAKFGEENFGTPSFAICKISAENPKQCVGKAFVGAWPYADMKKVIDSVLGVELSGTPSPTTTK